MIDIAAVRADTSGTKSVAHFNNAGASLMPDPVVATVVRYLDEEARTGGYETADRYAAEIDTVYGTIADLVGADPSEIAVTDSATRAWDLAFTGMRFEPGDRILTTTSEYASNVIAFLRTAERSGAIVEVVPNRPTGELDVEALDTMIDDRTRLIAINHMPTNSGLVNPAAAIGRIARTRGVPYLLDACQTVGQIPIDVGEIGCDMLSATSRKFLRGPRGAGFLYVRASMIDRLDPVTLDLYGARWVEPDRYEMRPDARRFELWERSPALILGMGRAAKYAMEIGVDAIWERDRGLAGTLRAAFAEIDGVTVRDIGSVRGAIVTFTIDGHEAAAVKAALAEHGINVSVVTPYAARYDMEARNLPDLVRASVHYYNSDAEIDRLVEAVTDL